MVLSAPFLLFALSLAGEDSATRLPHALRFDSQVASFGEVYQFADITATFTAENQAARAVRLTGLHAITSGGTVEADPADVVPPGGKLQVRVRQPVGNRLGQTAFRFRIETDDPGGPVMKLSASGFVQSAYDPEQVRVDFGLVERARGAQLETEVTTREADRLEVTGVEGVPEWLVLEHTIDRSAPLPTLKLKASVRPGAPLGVFSGVALVRTNVTSQPALEVTYGGAVDGNVVPSKHNFDFQALETGQRLEDWVRLRYRGGGAAPKVLRVDGLPPQATFSTRECASEPGCTLLAVTLTGGEPGFVKGTLAVYVDGEPDPLPFALGALVVAPGTPIKPVPVTTAEEAEAEPAITPGRSPAFGTAAAPQSPPPPSQVREVRLKWTAASEDRLYGYLVYRAEDRQGPYRRVSREIVRVQPAETGPQHRYEYVDREVQAGRTYFYYLDVITVGGRKVTFSGVLARTIAADAKAP
jgi:hypothetical protein